MKIKEFISNFINGFCMALADSVPGVSGGTIAFILGFYDKFVISLDNLLRGNREDKKDAVMFLLKIGIGWIFGFILAVSFLSNLFDKNIYIMSSLFIGFIVFAIPIVIKEELKFIKNHYLNIIFLILGMVFVLIITYLNINTGSSFDIDKFNLGTIIYVFFAASISISAMILPGISGSTFLLIFGLYLPIISKIKLLLKFDFSALPILIIFGLGVVFGIVFFTKILRKCLENKRSATVYFIIGMMLASIYSIIMGPVTMQNHQEPLSFATFNILYFILGGIIIFGLELLKKLLSKKEI